MMCGVNRRLLPVAVALLLATPFAMSAPAAADAPAGEISRITDSRIKESSGLAISTTHEDLAYTINDAGNPPIVYAVRISTGDVVGTTHVDGGDVIDSESIAIDGDGTVWLADLGDNKSKRDDAALYSFAEPGPGDSVVTAKRYAITYDGGPVDVEGLLVHPETGTKFLLSKEKKRGGTVYSLPATLSEDQPNVASDLAKSMPKKVTDATFTTDGSEVLVRTGDSVHVLDPQTWQEVRRIRVPEVKQGESIAMEPSGSTFIIGSEGKNSPLIRVNLDAEKNSSVVESSKNTGYAAPDWLLVVGAVVALGVAAIIGRVVSRRR